MFSLRPVARRTGQGHSLSFAPANIGRAMTWGAFAAVLIVLPLLFTKGFALTLLSQMGIWIIMCLAYNMLFGQGGMLSFGHAVYSGLGAFFAIHAINLASAGKFPIPLTLIPLVGGVFGALFGVIFGYVTTKKSGTPFAMITMGIGEMVFVATQMFPGFFGGEGGVTTNRVFGEAFMGINYGSAVQVYYLIAAWTFVCVVGMFAFSRTPLGRISNAVRENPERVEFFGYNTQYVRFFVLIVSAFFSGIAGGLSAINFEIVSGENVHAIRSGGILLATFIGGSLFFFGPILGAVIFAFFAIALSEYTKAWQFYLGDLLCPDGDVCARRAGRHHPGQHACLVTWVFQAAQRRLRRLAGDDRADVHGHHRADRDRLSLVAGGRRRHDAQTLRHDGGCGSGRHLDRHRAGLAGDGGGIRDGSSGLRQGMGQGSGDY